MHAAAAGCGFPAESAREYVPSVRSHGCQKTGCCSQQGAGAEINALLAAAAAAAARSRSGRR